MEIKTQIHTEERLCENTGRRWPSTSQGERPQKKPTLPTPWSQTSRLQNYETINVCCLSHPACGILLWRPWQPNTHPDRQSWLPEEEHIVFWRYLPQTKIQILKEIKCRKIKPTSAGSDSFRDRTSGPLRSPSVIREEATNSHTASQGLDSSACLLLFCSLSFAPRTGCSQSSCYRVLRKLVAA